MQKYLTILGLSTALVLSGQAMAHDDDHDSVEFHRVGSWNEIDTNNDDKISEAEYIAYEEDGRRNDKEWRKDHWAEMMEKFDGNDDNQLEKQEIDDYVERTVSIVMDKLGDMHGNWSGSYNFDFDDDEFSDRLEEKLERVGERVERAMERLEESEEIFGNMTFDFDFDDDHEVHEYAFSSNPHKLMFGSSHGKSVEELDADDDGFVSKEEFIRSRQDLFEKMDSNGDGTLDEEELKNFSWKGQFAFKWVEDDDEDEDND